MMNSNYNTISNWNCSNSSVSSSDDNIHTASYLTTTTTTNKRYRVPTLSPYDVPNSYFSSSASPPTSQPTQMTNMLTTTSSSANWSSSNSRPKQQQQQQQQHQQDDYLSVCSSSITNTPEMAFNYLTSNPEVAPSACMIVDPTIYTQNIVTAAAAGAASSQFINQVMFPQMAPSFMHQQQPETQQADQFEQKFMSHLYEQQQQPMQHLVSNASGTISSFACRATTSPNYFPSPIIFNNTNFSSYAASTTTTDYNGFYNDNDAPSYTTSSLPNNSIIRSTASATPSLVSYTTSYSNGNTNNNTTYYHQQMNFNHPRYTPSLSPPPLQQDDIKYTKTNSSKSSIKQEDNSDSNIFPCSSCDKSFSRPYNLKSHMRTHTLERPYECPYKPCGWKFARPHDLKRHELGHTGEKPHGCQFCHKQFARCDALKRHWKVDSNCAHALAMNGGKEAMMMKKKQQRKSLQQKKIKKTAVTNL